MRLITWKQLGIIASLIWVLVGPNYFHLSREENDKRIARDQYQRCIEQAWAKKGGVDRCNRDLRRAIAVAQWSSWAQVAFIPLLLAWLTAWGLSFRRRTQRSTLISEQPRPKVDVENSDRNEDYLPAPWTIEAIPQGFMVVDAVGRSLAYVYSRENPHDAAKVLTHDEARRIASNIAKLPNLLRKER